MADIKISELPQATSVSDSDIVVINQGNVTKTAARSLIRGTQNAGTVTSVTAGTGLTGGTITSSGTIAVSYGTASGTAAQGNDSRLSNARTPTAHASTHAVGGTDAITSVALTSASTITTTPTSANDIVNKSYADSIASGINFHDAADYGTIAVLSPAATYNQPGGASVGVGATLTGSTNVPLVVDGVTVATGKRILVKNQGSAFQNGIYTVTQQGDNATVPYILTRATDYDTSGSGINEVQAGDFVLVLNSTLANTAWVQQTPAPINFGVTAINFTQFAAAVAGVTTFSADATGFTPSTATNGTVTLGGTLNVAHGGTNQSSFTDGQLLIGNTTGNTLSKATLTAGTGMTVTNGSGAITLTAKGLGTQIKTVGIDAATIQGCINLCTDADGEHPYTVLIPPVAGYYDESLTLKGSVSLVGLTTPLNADAVQIRGAHTFTPASQQANTNRIGFQNLTFISGGTGSNTITCTSSTKYFSKLTFSGCIFSGDKADTYSHLNTDDNVPVYIDNCRFESSAGGSASAGVTQGNGPLYLSNNTTFDVYGRALDVPASTTTTRTATVTAGVGGNTTMTLTSGTTTGLAVGMKISGANLGTTVTIVSLTAPSTVIMSTTPKISGSFTATFGQTPYVEIHDSVLIGKGAETVRLGNGLLTCNTSNFTNAATVASSGFAGNGINMLTANTVVGIVSSSFTIWDVTAYVITAAAATCYAALNGISYSSSLLAAYSTLIGANVTVYDYAARATSVANGGTGQTTYTNGQLLIGNTTGNTLAKGTISGGTGITVTNGAGTISIATSGAGNATNLQGGNSTTLLGSVPYQSNTNVTTLLAPNTTTTKKFLRQTGTGSNGAAPAWDTIVAADVPTLNQNTTGTAAGLSATLAVASGGTGAATLTGILKGNGTSAISAATSGTDYVAGTDVSAYKVTAVLDTILSLSGATVTATKITFPSGAQSDIDSHVLAAGDIIFLTASTTTPNSSANKGPWVITTAGATGVSAVWDRPVWWTTGTARSGVLFSTNQGSIYQGSVWTIYPTAGTDVLITVGTTGLTALNVSLKAGLPVASGGTGTTSLTGIVKGNGVSAMTAADSGTDYVAGADVSSYRVTVLVSVNISPAIGGTTPTQLTFDIGNQPDIDGHTITLGDILCLTTQTNSTTRGPWVVTTLGTASVGMVLTRPNWFSTGTARSGVLMAVEKGTTGQGQIVTVYPTNANDPGINLGTTGLSTKYVFNKSGLTVASGGTGATDAATARTNLSAATFADVQVFTSNGTWTKPTGAKLVEIQLLGGGGGGGSGRRNSASGVAKTGGGGGGGGSYLKTTVAASFLSATESVTIGAGGTGGAAITTDATDGNAGSDGGTTIFSVFRANGASGGAGGAVASVAGGTGALNSNAGSASSVSTVPAYGAPGGATTTTQPGGAGGCAGGSVSGANVEYAGGYGGRSNILNIVGGAGGTAAGGNASNGGNNPNYASGVFAVGSGGGGGGGGLGVNGGTGGAGGIPASGGGGGGATSGSQSGAGGAGAVGLAMITTYF